MTDLRWRALLGVALILAGRGLRADESPSKPDLNGYRTVKDAETRAIVPTRAGLAGQTGYLGVSTTRDDKGRLVVEEVQPDSPAAKAGVEKGDVVARVDGETIRSPERFRESMQARGPGEPMKLALVRRGEAIERGRQRSAPTTSRPRSPNTQRACLGIALGESKEGEGVRIEQVMPDSPASAAGFKTGDRIFQVEGVDFTNPAKLTEILIEKKPGDDFEVTVRRGTEEIVLRPKLAAGLRAGFDRAGTPPWPGDRRVRSQGRDVARGADPHPLVDQARVPLLAVTSMASSSPTSGTTTRLPSRRWDEGACSAREPTMRRRARPTTTSTAASTTTSWSSPPARSGSWARSSTGSRWASKRAD